MVDEMMNREINIRPAEARDADALAGFNQAMARETEGKELDAEVLSRGVRNLLENQRYGFYLMAEASGPEHLSVGCLLVTYEWSDWRNGLFWWIQSVYITPEFRRRGVYRRLYEYVKEMAAREQGVRGFRLYVEKENRVAQRTYEQLGMNETEYLMYEELLET